jgi:hypothetical protein
MLSSVARTALPGFDEKLDAFFRLFEPTFQLADFLMKAKFNAQEIVLLLCAG